MGKLAALHAKPKGQFPKRSDVEPLIERTHLHWYWLGEFTDDPFGDHAPVFATFSVVRLIWHWEYGYNGLPRQLSLVNTCGVFACVNPKHWECRSLPLVDVIVTLPPGQDAWPIRAQNSAYVVHIAHDDATHAVCGTRSHDRIDRDANITCINCVRAWRSRGGQLLETKKETT